jgi:hypothetical protein
MMYGMLRTVETCRVWYVSYNTYILYLGKEKDTDPFFVINGRHLLCAPHCQRDSNAAPKDAVVVLMKRTCSVRSLTPIMF